MMDTIAHYCGVDVGSHRIDGKNIAPVIASADAPSPHEVLHWQTRNHWAVRKGNWKLVNNGPASTFKGREIPKVKTFLANLAEDLSETNNYADANPEIVRELTALHDEWAKQVEEQ